MRAKVDYDEGGKFAPAVLINYYNYHYCNYHFLKFQGRISLFWATDSIWRVQVLSYNWGGTFIFLLLPLIFVHNSSKTISIILMKIIIILRIQSTLSNSSQSNFYESLICAQSIWQANIDKIFWFSRLWFKGD